MPPINIPNLIGEAEYAAMRGVTLRTIQRERALRAGPPFVKLGAKVYYRLAAIEAWVLKQELTHLPAKKSA